MKGQPLEQIGLVFKQVHHLEVTGKDPRLQRYVDIDLDVGEQLLLAGKRIHYSSSMLSPAAMQEHPLFHCAKFELATLGSLLIASALVVVLVATAPAVSLKLYIIIV